MKKITTTQIKKGTTFNIDSRQFVVLSVKEGVVRYNEVGSRTSIPTEVNDFVLADNYYGFYSNFTA